MSWGNLKVTKQKIWKRVLVWLKGVYQKTTQRMIYDAISTSFKVKRLPLFHDILCLQNFHMLGFRLMNTTAWTISIQNMSCDERKALEFPWIKHVYLRISKDAGDVVSEIFLRIYGYILVDLKKIFIQTTETTCTNTDEPWIKNKGANHPILKPKYWHGLLVDI